MVRGGAYLPKRLGMVGICVLVSILAIALFVSPALACHGWISDRVWEDSNGNGIQDEGEPGISGVTVKLHKCSDDSVITTKVTDSNGLYQFQAATLGNYYIEFAAPVKEQVSVKLRIVCLQQLAELEDGVILHIGVGHLREGVDPVVNLQDRTELTRLQRLFEIID